MADSGAVAKASANADAGSIDAVVFDMDGLLIDSEPWWHVAETAAFNRVGIEMTEDNCNETTGLRIDEVVEHHFNRVGGWDEDVHPKPVVVAGIVDEMVRLIRTKANAMPGAVEAVQMVKKMGFRVALASSSPMVLISAGVERLGLGDNVFEVICSAQHQKLGKPHPGVYLDAAAKLGVPPTRCLALEDSLNGVLAAKSARMRCIAVPEPGTAPGTLVRFAVADLVLPSLDRSDLPTVFKSFCAAPSKRLVAARDPSRHTAVATLPAQLAVATNTVFCNF